MMKNLQKISEKLGVELEKKDLIRERALKTARDIVRKCGEAVQKMHLNENADRIISAAKKETKNLISVIREHPDIYYSGFVESAFQELCEASIISAVLEKKDLPDPDELGVTYTSYLLGLGDAVGELRRFSLDSLLEGDTERAKWYLELMEEFYSVLMKFDLPTAIVAIRKKQDLARSLIEKTRGELVIAIREKSLEKKIDKLLKG